MTTANSVEQHPRPFWHTPIWYRYGAATAGPVVMSDVLYCWCGATKWGVIEVR